MTRDDQTRIDLEEEATKLKQKLNNLEPTDEDYKKVHNLYMATIEKISEFDKVDTDYQKAELAQETEAMKACNDKKVKILDILKGIGVTAITGICGLALWFLKAKETERYVDLDLNGGVITSNTTKDMKRDLLKR